MTDYKSMYLKLFGRVTDVIEFLQKAQQEREEHFIQGEDHKESGVDNK